MDVKVKEEGVIAGAQGFRKVEVQSKILFRKYVSPGYRQENNTESSGRCENGMGYVWLLEESRDTEVLLQR